MRDETLFNRPGHLPLSEYVSDIHNFEKQGRWRLPFGVRDRLFYLFLRAVARFTRAWGALAVRHSSLISPAYALLLAYLKARSIYDQCFERPSSVPGYYAYTLIKRAPGREDITLHANGVAKTRSEALSKGIGEMVERTITGMGDMTPPLRGSVCEMQRRGEDLLQLDFHRFLPMQMQRFSELKTNEYEPIEWVAGERIYDGTRVLIPRDVTSWMHLPGTRKGVWRHTTTNGSALAFSAKDAMTKALLEVVERDAFFVHWLTGIPPERIDPLTLPEAIRSELSWYERRGIQLIVLHTTTNIHIPSVCLVAVSAYAEVPSVAVSASARLTCSEAIADALREMVVCAQSLDERSPVSVPELEPFVSNLSKRTRPLYWRGADRVRTCDWFLSGSVVSFDDLAGRDSFVGHKGDALSGCVRELRRVGLDYDPIVFWPTNELQERLGCVVAQVFVPKAFPLYLYEGYGTFDSDRLREFAAYKGVEDWTLNPVPHMFV